MRFNKLLLVSIMALSVVVTVLAIYTNYIQKPTTVGVSTNIKIKVEDGGLRLVDGCDAQCEAQRQYDRDFNGAGRELAGDEARLQAAGSQAEREQLIKQIGYERDLGLIKRYEVEYASPTGKGGEAASLKINISGIPLYSPITDKGMSRAETDLYIRSLQNTARTGASGGGGSRAGVSVSSTSSATLSDLDPVEVTVPVAGGSVKFKITLTPKEPDDITMAIETSCVVGTTAGNCTDAMLTEALTKTGNVRDFFTELASLGINVPALLAALTTQCIGKPTCTYSTNLRAFLVTPTPGGPTTNPTAGPSPTPTLIPTPTKGTDATVPTDRVSIRLRIRPQGVMTERELPYNKLKVAVSVGGGVGTTALARTTEAVTNEFSSVGDGMFEGTVTFDPKILKPGSGYKVLVKAGKHLAKRFCSPEPNKGKISPDSSYTCPQINAGVISLKNGLNDFDFSRVFLPAGDLAVNGKQDGVVDSTDFTYIRKKIPSEDPEALRVGDINMDGAIDTQDYVLTISNLVNNVDEL